MMDVGFYFVLDQYVNFALDDIGSNSNGRNSISRIHLIILIWQWHNLYLVKISFRGKFIRKKFHFAEN